MISVLSAIIVIGVLVLVHEFGHFIVARFFNIKVLKFSIGFGPKLFGINVRETEYLVSAIPLGGYVKLYGEEDEEIVEEKERAFCFQKPFRKILVVFAGPLFNFFFAFLVFFLVNALGYKTISSKVGDVKEGYPAYVAGIRKGDIITKIENKPVKVWEDVSRVIKNSKGNQLSLEVKRQNNIFYTNIVPKYEKAKNLFGEEVNTPIVGIMSSDELVYISYPVHEAFIKSGYQVYELTKLTLLTVYKLINRVVPVSSLGGPIMITKLAGETAKTGILNLVAFMALLSINLGVLNLLPIPILDGGHIVLFGYEAITGKKPSQRFKEVFTYVGIMLIVMLTVTVFYNDIARIFFEKK